MLRDRHLRTLLLGAFLAGSFLLLEELTWGLSVDLVQLRDWVIGGAFAAAVVLAPDAVRARRGGALVIVAAALVYLGGLSLATTSVLAAGAVLLGRLGARRRMFDVALVAAGLILASVIAAQTVVTEALALWCFFLVQSLHPVFVEGDMIAGNDGPKPTPDQADAFTAARDEILSAIG
jgi:hypothetical protein